jgi:hypothetical protein
VRHGRHCDAHRGTWAAARKAVKPSAKDVEVAKAEALVAEVDALPEMVVRVGRDDVQAALETIANGGAAETHLGEAGDSGTEEADAA